MVQYGRPSRFCWTTSAWSSLGRTVMAKTIWENPSAARLGKGFQLRMLIRTPWKRVFLICECGWHQIGWNQNIDPMDKVLHKEFDLGEPTSFLDYVYLDCTQRKCEISKDIVVIYRTMFESRISAGGVEKLPFPQNLRISSWSYDMTGHAKKCVERYCELTNKTTQQLFTVSTPCNDDLHFKEEETKSVGELSNTCSQIVLKCLYLARIGRLDVLWSVNKLARSITKWTKACDKRPNRLISYIHHTCEYKQYCHVGNTAKQCRLGLFQDSDFAGDLEDSKSTSGGTLCIFGSHMFVPISWMCKKQTAVSHSSTESKSFPWTKDGGWTVNPRFIYGIWSTQRVTETRIRVFKNGETRTNFQRERKFLERLMIQTMLILFPQTSNLLIRKLYYMFLKTMKQWSKWSLMWRSPTMRHISTTHSVALDWLFDRINLDSKIQIKYIDIKKQLADILTKAKFHTWWMESFLCLFNISHFSSSNCSEVMSKRTQDDAGEEESQQNQSRWWILYRDVV